MSGVSFQALLAGNGPPATIAFQSSSLSTTNSTSQSYTAMGIGAAAADRYVLVALYSLSLATNSISTVTIGGITATLVGTSVEGSSGGAFARIAFYIAAVPTGTTATVAVTYSAGAFRSGCAAWMVNSLQSPTATFNSTSTTSTASGSMNVSTGGIGIAAACAFISGATTSYTWTGLTKVFDLPNSQDTFSGSSNAFAAAQSGLSVTATPLAAGTANSAAFIALR